VFEEQQFGAGKMQNQPMQNGAITGKASIGMDGNIAAALGYVIGIIDIIVLCTEKENKVVKFHSLQALLFHIGAGLLMALLIVVMVVFDMLLTFIVIGTAGAANGNAAGPAGAIVAILWILLYPLILLFLLGFLVVNILCAVKAYGGKTFRLPIVGKFAANFAKLDEV
jgi:uncharacterized membrane protein